MERGTAGAHACDVDSGTRQRTTSACNTELQQDFSYFNFSPNFRNNYGVCLPQGEQHHPPRSRRRCRGEFSSPSPHRPHHPRM